MSTAVRRYDACCAYVTPFGSSGRVSCPYSVSQIGMFFRPNHLSRLTPNLGSVVIETFGQRTICVGGWFAGDEYGWCA